MYKYWMMLSDCCESVPGSLALSWWAALIRGSRHTRLSLLWPRVGNGGPQRLAGLLWCEGVPMPLSESA